MSSIKQILHQTYYFKNSDEPIPNLDIELLLAHSINKPREYILTHQDIILSNTQKNNLNNILRRRQNYEPFAYITGYQEFYGIDFVVTPDTLIPRPETEKLIDICLKNIEDIVNPAQTIRIVDIGTGTGCIPISILYELRQRKIKNNIQFYALDNSDKALDVASINTHSYQLHNNIIFKKINILDKSEVKRKLKDIKFDIVISNPPYIPSNLIQSLKSNVKDYEPREALDGGEDGLLFYRAILENLKENQTKTTTFLLEIHETLGSKIKNFVLQHFPNANVEILKDVFGVDRYLSIIN